MQSHAIIDLGIDSIGIALGMGERAYHRFTTDSGIGGLARWENGRLDILAVHSDVEGRGRFRRFISYCQSKYHTICVWEVWNEGLKLALSRYGFQEEIEIQSDGEVLEGMRWDKTNKEKGQK